MNVGATAAAVLLVFVVVSLAPLPSLPVASWGLSGGARLSGAEAQPHPSNKREEPEAFFVSPLRRWLFACAAPGLLAIRRCLLLVRLRFLPSLVAIIVRRLSLCLI